MQRPHVIKQKKEDKQELKNKNEQMRAIISEKENKNKNTLFATGCHVLSMPPRKPRLVKWRSIECSHISRHISVVYSHSNTSPEIQIH